MTEAEVHVAVEKDSVAKEGKFRISWGHIYCKLNTNKSSTRLIKRIHIILIVFYMLITFSF